MKKLLILTALVSLFAFGAFAQATDTEITQANANIIGSIALTRTAHLNFGDIVANAAGTVIVDTAGARTASGPGLAGGTASAAAFDVAGQSGKTYVVGVPTSAVTINGPSSSTMTVTAFTVSAGPYTLTGGADTFTVGGTLTVGASQTIGAYTGNFNVTVSYN